ncbi:hypothetical protein Tco_0765136 [Tanacetum coccineum]
MKWSKQNNTKVSSQQPSQVKVQDKGKGIMVEEPLKMKKKDQISFDEKEAIRLQAEFDEEERLARGKDEANVALTEEWNDIQAKIDVDYQMAQQMQVEEQEKLSIEEKSKLFVQLLEARKKHFAAINMDTKLVEGSEVRVEGSETRAEGNEEEVTLDAIPLAVKSSSIVD